MPGSVYDTHAFVKRLTEAGLPQPQAEVMAAENVHLLASQLATKDDLFVAVARLERRIDGLEHRIDQLENRLLIRLGALMIALQAAALAVGSLF